MNGYRILIDDMYGGFDQVFIDDEEKDLPQAAFRKEA
jgi:hypothetical protein